MKTLRYAFARTLPIMAGYLVLGLGVSLICLVIFGSSNFLIPSMLGHHGGTDTAARPHGKTCAKGGSRPCRLIFTVWR